MSSEAGWNASVGPSRMSDCAVLSCWGRSSHVRRPLTRCTVARGCSVGGFEGGCGRARGFYRMATWACAPFGRSDPGWYMARLQRAVRGCSDGEWDEQLGDAALGVASGKAIAAAIRFAASGLNSLAARAAPTCNPTLPHTTSTSKFLPSHLSSAGQYAVKIIFPVCPAAVAISAKKTACPTGCDSSLVFVAHPSHV